MKNNKNMINISWSSETADWRNKVSFKPRKNRKYFYIDYRAMQYKRSFPGESIVYFWVRKKNIDLLPSDDHLSATSMEAGFILSQMQEQILIVYSFNTFFLINIVKTLFIDLSISYKTRLIAKNVHNSAFSKFTLNQKSDSCSKTPHSSKIVQIFQNK